MVALLTILQIVFSIIVVSLSTYGIITSDYQWNFLLIFFLGLLILILGMKEFQRGQKVYGWIYMGVFLFIEYVSIQTFF
ncbi:DUF3953 domain-containing protein [Lysinibacillus fusiformis]|uniref:DUF3953 domain-containing protein n=1 Tax=Lysinibacillus fusiformis TaxID=28031 RepID=UPI001968241A|nr:DUF3953 domain-containing protein [Lysinibacillus fusiformis]QSB12536.1 DUF3953 domain-containing protein [Lysinibacillus fusiformis]